MRRTRFAPAALLPALLLALIVPVTADEGMWLFDKAPKETILKKYGFAMTPEWLEHLRLSSVRFGGASASFVSPDGLVLTNHHVGQGAIQNLSTAERDLMKTGFYARTRAEELKCPGVELRVLREIDDVTDRVLGAETADMTPARAAEARDKAIAAIEREASGSTGLKCQVVNLYSGSMYHLYEYKAYDDVRLVFAPEYLFAFFGGDPDNFTYPRFDLDISIFRVYENGETLKTPHYLKWATQGVREGDLVFCSGNPGSTGRLLTLAQLEFLRGTTYPFSIANLKRRQALVREYGKMGPGEARIALRSLFGIENSLKATLGYQSGLLDPKLMESKAAAERLLREAVAKDPALAKDSGGAWDAVAGAQNAYGSFFKRYTFFERANGFYTPYFNMARNLVRRAMEKARPDDLRLREYRDSNLPSVERSLLSPSPIYDEFEIVKLTDSLTQLREELGDTPEVKWILGGREPDEVARELVSGTKLKDPAIRKALMEGGLDAIYASEDPMIKLALLVDPVSRGVRARHEKEVEAVETRSGAQIARAMFRLKGTAIAPDATSTLRLSYGVVKGYVDNGAKVPYRTTFAGLYERSRRAGDKAPYELPPAVLAKKPAVGSGTPLNYVSTCDSIGGNSGSPVVNRKGEFTGVLFDGNIQSLPTRFVYEDAVSRSVMVHASGIIEALVKIYGAKPLADEILGRK
ncbi:MAG TPA: S46 family peptidase [Acidobacteriota bacterium]|nr:S46 family peptidase [Acidobacteriota bacterium]